MSRIGYKRHAMDFNLKDENGGDYINNRRFSFAILEKADKIKFETFGVTTDYANWDKGRLFGEAAELKWHKRNGVFHLVIIADEDPLPEVFFEFKCSNLRIVKPKDHEGKEEDRTIFLWGIKDENTRSWIDDRIPQLIKYPVPLLGTKKRAKVLVREYQFEETFPESEEKITSTVYRFVRLIQDVDKE